MNCFLHGPDRVESRADCAAQRWDGLRICGGRTGRLGMDTTATILHADLDAFYASVEQLIDPSLRGKPIAVGGGVVLAASYEAKAFGISGGMSGRRARELCPQLIFVGGHFKDYQRLGDAAIRFAKASGLAPDVRSNT